MEDWRLLPARDLGLPIGERLRSTRREASWAEAALHLLWVFLVWAYLRICHRLRVEGRERLPLHPPFILVANHGSHLDALVLTAVLPVRLQGSLYPLAARDAFFGRGPRAAFAALFLNALPIRRRPAGPDDVQGLRSRLREEPCGYVLFPEGTRTRTGRMGAFRPGIGRLVAGTEVPVIPCFLSGAFEAAPPRCLIPRCRKITLTVGTPLFFEAEESSREGCHRIALRVESAVRALGRDPGRIPSPPGLLVHRP